MAGDDTMSVNETLSVLCLDCPPTGTAGTQIVSSSYQQDNNWTLLDRLRFVQLDNFTLTNLFVNNTISNDTSIKVEACSSIDSNTYNWWALLLCVFPVLTLFGNVLVIVSVFREKNLQTATNFFIVSLAVADLLVAVGVMPFGVYYLFLRMWCLPNVVCDGYIAMDVTCSTSSIFNLVAISVDRYIAVTRPIMYAKHKSDGRVWTMIAITWIVSTAIGSPLVLGLNDTPDRPANECLFNSKDYLIYSSLISFYIPCIIMSCLYYSIFMAIRRRAKKQRFGKKVAATLATAISTNTSAVVIENLAQTRRLDGDTSTNTASGSQDDDDDDELERTEMGACGGEDVSAKKSARFMLASVVEETGLIMANLATPIPLTDMTTTVDSGYSPSNLEAETKEHTPPGSPRPRLSFTTFIDHKKRTAYRKKLTRPGTGPAVNAPRRRFRSAVSAARFTIFRNNRNKMRAKSFAKKEKKATQTLAIVLGVFLCCWAPFFTCSVLDAICVKRRATCSPGVNVFMATTWLGYINSFLNPVIYTIFNPEFRKAFKKILHL